MLESSDDESEIILQEVSNYHFVDGEDEPISFSELPIRWDDKEELDGKQKQIFLKGSGDNGLQPIYRQVLEWKFNISDEKPEISVLAKGIGWITLEKPRKSYEEIIRTIFITLHCLYLVKEDPEISRKSLWDQLSRALSSYDPLPSEKDLVDHIALIREAVRRDRTLAKAEFIVTFLEEKPQKKKLSEQDVATIARPEFIVSDHMDEEDEEGSDEDEDLFDSVCSICDNGGEIIVCEGRCLRSFHAIETAGLESECETLRYSTRQVKAIQNFFCANCENKQHQCFVCGKLGSSDKEAHAEVFPCVSATCGHFYHPHCVAGLLHHGNASEAEKLEKKISAGESFTCPIHKCCVCKLGENKTDVDLQFAICRRCPKSYHRKCLPRDIAFEDDNDTGLVQRAWDDLIPNRVLIYCLEHEIDEVLRTPIRNHLKFPGGWPNKKKQASEQLPKKVRTVPKDNSVVIEVSKKQKSSTGKVRKQTERSPSIMDNGSSRSSVKRRVGSLDISNKKKVGNLSKPSLKATGSFKEKKVSMDDNGPSLGDQLYSLVSRTKKGEIPDQEDKQTMSNEHDDMLSLDAESQKRILALVEEASSSITLQDITKSNKMPMIYSYSSKASVDKGITLGKVEGSIEAMRESLQKLKGGCSVEDAKAVCEPQLVNQIVRWRNKLKVYLSPFLHGMRYTSFGRHFTKVDKLKEIVNKVHWYAQEGDTIVDFCCGANDFSWFMKNKMDETKKKCFYKNYDVFQAKNDFNFRRQDWMTVRPKELPKGSKLIIGLNPPFGVNAVLANKFINKALEFKPKLLILIVPREAERLEKKNPPYEMIWEDTELLRGMSFYLPGSIDVNDNQMEDWNVNAPPLYLWSRPDWADRHKEIAEQNGHLNRKTQIIESQHEPAVQVPIMIDNQNTSSENQLRRSRNPKNACSPKTDEKNASESNRNSNKRKRNGNEGSNRERLSGDPLSSDRMEKRSAEPTSDRIGTERRSVDKTPTYPRKQYNFYEIPKDVPLRGEIPKEEHGLSSRALSSHSELNKERYFRNDQFGSGGSNSNATIVDDIGGRYREEPYSGTNPTWPGLRQGYAHSYHEREQPQPHPHPLRYHTQIYGTPENNNTFSHISSSSYLAATATGSRTNPHSGSITNPHSGFGSSHGHQQMVLGIGSRVYNHMNNNTAELLQRYGSHLDETNHARRPEFSPVVYGGIRPVAQPPGHFGFAPGAYRPPHFNPNNTSGWYND
ncbi:protein ENHANCED DOWNY MILDEW 2-like [Impatiens glandulifera]|uniref:protein ENHANCED DOWNY MILDEW 2-like n=1 Tax=Impatiens glandulifera TaxID=253017 RepID=UPI001FB18E96|nr:protein ENHANCED DOWNY MILDEW 2-like [Impatiens glandulifera]